MAEPLDQPRATYDPRTAVITVTLPDSVWQELPSNSADFSAVTLEEDEALRALLTAIWLARVSDTDLDQP